MTENTSITNSTEIQINDLPKKQNGELSTLKHSIEEENENEIISQSEEMIKKQRQITNFDVNNVEQAKTNNILNKSYFYHKLGNCHAFFGNKFGDPLIIIGPQWPMFIALTLIVNVIVWFFIIKFWKIYSKFFKGLEFFVIYFSKLLSLIAFSLIQDFQKMILEDKRVSQKNNINFVLNVNFIMI